MLKNKTVILGVTGSIASYKAASLASMLVKNHASVYVIMTRNAENFINPITFETLTNHKCLIDTFDRNFEFNVEHVSLAKKADVFIVAPATANFIAKAAHGLADDMLTTTFLAANCPKLISPAMNTGMYENPITQDNIAICKKYGMKIIEPASGHLACGDEGKGKLPEPEELFEHICKAVAADSAMRSDSAKRADFSNEPDITNSPDSKMRQDLKGKKIIVTAGPTQEALDPVRYITNHSTGKMGYAIAKAAAARGASVTLISGPVNLPEPDDINVINIITAKEMFEAVKNNYADADIVIKAAAVADYRPKIQAAEKIKKSDKDAVLELERTDDILLYLGQHKTKQFLCGFSMETENIMENSCKKLKKKNLDMVVANSLRTSGAGFGTDTNVVTIITKGGQKELPIMSKDEVAHKILDNIIENS